MATLAAALLLMVALLFWAAGTGGFMTNGDDDDAHGACGCLHLVAGLAVLAAGGILGANYFGG